MNSKKTKFYYKELELLRGELNNLKECQLKYFTFSITATGIILGIVSRFDFNFSSMLYLLPLTVLIPAWLVFFDKAKTITRIVAYYRFLESIILNNVFFNFIGWENSLMRFREWEVNTDYNDFKESETFYCAKKEKFSFFQRIISKFKGIKPPVGSYWFLVNLSFSGLIVVCISPLFMETFFHPNIYEISFWILITSILSFGLAFVYNYVITYNSLIGDGRHSYTTNMKIWCDIFKIDYCKYIKLINGKISIANFFTDEFMENYTDYSNFNEMISKSNLSKLEKEVFSAPIYVQLDIEYDKITKNNELNKDIGLNTEFKDLNEMLKKAKMEYLEKMLA